MTHSQCLKMIKSMKRDVCRSIDAEAMHLIKSGGIDIIETPKTSYAPAKIILAICLERVAHEYKPLFEPYIEEYKNLKHF